VSKHEVENNRHALSSLYGKELEEPQKLINFHFT